MGSLTGVVASKSVTEASKGTLRPIGNRSESGLPAAEEASHEFALPDNMHRACV